jgi:hypothetical protein
MNNFISKIRIILDIFISSFSLKLSIKVDIRGKPSNTKIEKVSQTLSK